ncbi:ATP-dependent Clp protease ATP-binding subunit CLPT2, chloroplastic [Linum perenne]
MASSTLSSLPISSSFSRSSSERNISRIIPSSLSQFTGTNLPIRRLSSSSVVLKCRRTRVATVSATLPTKSYDVCVVFRWSCRTIRSYGLAELEARKLKYTETGTECLLLGILIEGTSSAAKFLRANGVTTYKFRDEVVNMLGRRYFLTETPEFPPPTEQALRALDKAIEEKLKSGRLSILPLNIRLLHTFSPFVICMLECAQKRSNSAWFTPHTNDIGNPIVSNVPLCRNN